MANTFYMVASLYQLLYKSDENLQSDIKYVLGTLTIYPWSASNKYLIKVGLLKSLHTFFSHLHGSIGFVVRMIWVASSVFLECAASSLFQKSGHAARRSSHAAVPRGNVCHSHGCVMTTLTVLMHRMRRVAVRPFVLLASLLFFCF